MILPSPPGGADGFLCMRKTIIYLLALMTLTAMSAFLGWRSGFRYAVRHLVPEAKTDTIIRRDTVTYATPIPILTTIVDTILVAYPDIVTIHDTVFAQLTVERKRYAGGDYRAVVSGYRPSLDTIQVFPKTVTVTETVRIPVKRSRWAVGVQAGYGITEHDGTVAMSPYIGIGVSCNLNL